VNHERLRVNREQTSLFSVRELQRAKYAQAIEPLQVSLEALQTWKQRIYQFQQTIQVGAAIEQGDLFSTAPSPLEIAATIAPFALPQQNMDFWRWQFEDTGTAAYYFVIDYQLPILLYVGETIKANQRWKGEHDCKRYVENYVLAHRQCNTDTTIGIAFLHWAPTAARARQQLETALIYRWRSPFNKQNWTFWGTPFTGGK